MGSRFIMSFSRIGKETFPISGRMSENLIYLTILYLPIFLITRMLNSRACLFCTDSKLQLAA